jgi:hypothetical protein
VTETPTDDQLAIAYRFGVRPQAPLKGEKIGIARNVRDSVWPINGLRHQVAGDTSGWYIWAGEELSDSPAFFVPLHVEHLVEWCPLVIPYLALPAGWRFLLAPGHEDVWYDEDLLTS